MRYFGKEERTNTWKEKNWLIYSCNFFHPFANVRPKITGVKNVKKGRAGGIIFQANIQPCDYNGSSKIKFKKQMKDKYIQDGGIYIYIFENLIYTKIKHQLANVSLFLTLLSQKFNNLNIFPANNLQKYLFFPSTTTFKKFK